MSPPITGLKGLEGKGYRWSEKHLWTKGRAGEQCILMVRVCVSWLRQGLQGRPSFPSQWVSSRWNQYWGQRKAPGHSPSSNRCHQQRILSACQPGAPLWKHDLSSAPIGRKQLNRSWQTQLTLRWVAFNSSPWSYRSPSFHCIVVKRPKQPSCLPGGPNQYFALLLGPRHIKSNHAWYLIISH